MNIYHHNVRQNRNNNLQFCKIFKYKYCHMYSIKYLTYNMLVFINISEVTNCLIFETNRTEHRLFDLV